MKKTNKAIAIFIISILSMLLCLGCFFTLFTQLYKILDRPTAQEGQERAVELIEALEQYKSDTDAYPPELDSLVPAYLSTLPQPAPGTNYDYELLSNGKEFTISFTVGISIDGDYCTYYSSSQIWQCSDLI